MPTPKIEGIEPGENGSPLSTEVGPDGARRHFMADGRTFVEDGPKFRLEYQSLFPGKTYKRDIAVFGLAEETHLFEAWCFVYGALRKYAFAKVVSIEALPIGERITGEEMRVLMGGTKLPGREV